MNGVPRRLNLNLCISMVILYAYIIYSFTPILSKNYYIGLILLVLWFLSAIFNRRILANLIFTLENYIIYAWIIYIIFLRFIGFSQADWGNYFTFIMFFFSYISYNAYNRILSFNQKRKVLKFSLLTLTVNIISNIITIFMNPNITIEMNFIDTEIYSNLNIGNTIYSLLWLLMTITMLWILMYRKQKKNLLVLLSVFSGVAYPILASKTTAFLILFLCILILVWSKLLKKNDSFSKLFFTSLFIVIIIITAPKIIETMNNFITNEYISKRLEALSSFQMNSIYFSRLELAKLSFSTFMDKPIFGAGYIKVSFDGSIANVFLSGVGHHSELIDHLARYGIVGFVFYFVIFKNYFKNLNRIARNSDDRLLKNVVVFATTLFSLLNNSFTSYIGIAVFLLLPMVLEVYGEKELEIQHE